MFRYYFPIADVDAIANSDDGRDSDSGRANAELENSKQLTDTRASEEEQQQHKQFHSRTRQQSLISSADFENWYLKKREDDDENDPASRLQWTEHAESRSLVGSCEHLNRKSAGQTLEQEGQSRDTRTSPDSANGSSTTKRARRNSTGQIAGAVLLNGGCGMNLQSTGQTAAVGKGYHQTTAPSQNSLSGECPWYLQNPGPGAAAALNNNNNNINSNVPPPTAPLRQHKRPAPQPGGHSPFPASHLPPHNQSHSQNLSHTVSVILASSCDPFTNACIPTPFAGATSLDRRCSAHFGPSEAKFDSDPSAPDVPERGHGHTAVTQVTAMSARQQQHK